MQGMSKESLADPLFSTSMVAMMLIAMRMCCGEDHPAQGTTRNEISEYLNRIP